MPKSRKRKPRRARGAVRPAATPRRRVATVRPGQDLSDILTEEDHRLMRAHMDAAARGDARAAYEHLVAGAMVEGTITPYLLRELVLLGDDAPGWMYSRWCADQSYRWMLLEEDQRTDTAVRQTMIMAHWDRVEPILDDEVAFLELGSRIAGGDRLCSELATFEYAGLRDFLDVKADPALLDRCDRIGEWAEARMGGFVLEQPVAGALQVRDLAEGATLEVLNLGALSDRAPGAAVIGRLVPISVDPGLMFESRPIDVDLETARQVARAVAAGDPDDWVPVIGDARRDGRLPYAFSCGRQTLYSSDLVPLEPFEDPGGGSASGPPPGRLVELLDAGLDDYQANGVMVAEVALIVVRVSGADGVASVGPHLAAVMYEPRVFEALQVHCAESEHARGWRLLASGLPEPARSRCLAMAELCAA